MLKFLHTSDWQMGMKAEYASERAHDIREARLKAAENVLSVARKEGLDFIIIAGDLFEDNAVEPVLVQKVSDLLSCSPCPIYIIPGNHDPFTPNSVYKRELWNQSGSKVHVLNSEEPIEAGAAIIYPCPLSEKSSRQDPTSWIPIEENNRIRIGIAHGSLTISKDISRDDFPIDPDAATKHGLDYLALGHWHSTSKYPTKDGIERTAYSGTHETTKFGEKDSGQVLVIEIAAKEAEPDIHNIPTGTLQWEQWRRNVTNVDDLRNLIDELGRTDNPGSILLEVILEGTLDAEGLNMIESQLRPILESRYLYYKLMERVIPHPTESEMNRLAQGSAMKNAIRRLSEMADPGADTILPDGMTPEIAKRASLLLYSILAEEAR
jgi:DNA repair exonuclease SbcCD nuclease subunit